MRVQVSHITMSPNLRGGEKGRHIGVGNGPMPFVGQGKCVDRYGHRSDGTDGKEGLDEFDGVPHDEGDPAPAPDPSPDQRACPQFPTLCASST